MLVVKAAWSGSRADCFLCFFTLTLSNAFMLSLPALAHYFVRFQRFSDVQISFVMAVPTFSFSNADVSPGRSATIVEARKTHLLTSLTEKFGLAHAEFLATHVGFESDDLDWEGVRPLGKGAFGTVGLWAAKDGTGTIVRVSENEKRKNSAAYTARKLLSSNAISSELWIFPAKRWS